MLLGPSVFKVLGSPISILQSALDYCLLKNLKRIKVIILYNPYKEDFFLGGGGRIFFSN